MVQMIEVHDKDGNLLRIETYKESGEHLLDFLWDSRDAQNHENRVEFRKWVVRHLKQSGNEVAE